MALHFEYENPSTQEWVAYDEQANKAISEAYVGGKDTASVVVNTLKVNVHIKDMKHVDEKGVTKNVRRIRKEASKVPEPQEKPVTTTTTAASSPPAEKAPTQSKFSPEEQAFMDIISSKKLVSLTRSSFKKLATEEDFKNHTKTVVEYFQSFSEMLFSNRLCPPHTVALEGMKPVIQKLRRIAEFLDEKVVEDKSSNSASTERTENDEKLALEEIERGWVDSLDVLDEMEPVEDITAALSAVKLKETTYNSVADIIAEAKSVVPTDDRPPQLAVTVYTLHSEIYVRVNKALRNEDKEEIATFLPFIKLLSTELETLPSVEGQYLYRGININLGLSVEGLLLTWRSFTSTTRNTRVARNFISTEGGAYSGTLYVVESFSGTLITPYSKLHQEDEVLFSPNTQLRIKRVFSNADKSLLGGLLKADLKDVLVCHLWEIQEITRPKEFIECMTDRERVVNYTLVNELTLAERSFTSSSDICEVFNELGVAVKLAQTRGNVGLFQILNNIGVDLDSDFEGFTPLSYAAQEKDTSLVRVLLQMGCTYDELESDIRNYILSCAGTAFLKKAELSPEDHIEQLSTLILTTKPSEIISQLDEISKDLTEGEQEQGFAFEVYGRAYSKAGEHEKALVYFTKAIQIRKKAKANEQDEPLSQLYYYYGEALMLHDEHEKAITNAQQSIRLRRKVYGKISIEVAQSMALVGEVYYRSKRYTNAKTELEKALEIARECETSGVLGEILYCLGCVSDELGESEAALEYLEEALSVRQSSRGRDNQEYGLNLYKIAKLHSAGEESELALQFANDALQVLQPHLGPGDPLLKEIKEFIEKQEGEEGDE